MAELTQDDLVLLSKRFSELASRSYNAGIFTFTDFLGLAEQNVLRQIEAKLPPRVGVTLFGGAEGAERIMVRFGNEEELGYELPFPITTLDIRPKAIKFAQQLTHRDVLGALMHLGIERCMLGDIVLFDEGQRILVFVIDSIADFICENLSAIKNTSVTAKRTEELSIDGPLFRTESVIVKAMSERLDGIIAKLYQLSREQASALFAKSLVFVEGRTVTSPSYQPKKGERISVRTLGRFIYNGYVSDTKKGKMNLEVQKYI